MFLPFKPNKLLFFENMSLKIHVTIILIAGVMCVFACNTKSKKSPALAPGTFRVCDKKPGKHVFYDQITTDSHQQKITQLPLYQENNCMEILQKSNFPSKTYFSKNGFVNTVVEAYNEHHNLIIRPDDVWAAIITQFSFYINNQTDEYQRKFVNFTGQKELTVNVTGSLRAVEHDKFVKSMIEEIHANLVDTQVKDWILPSFSTTTDNDLVTVGVTLMATMKKYSSYSMTINCGIPYVTLLGSIQDWESILSKLEKLKEFNLDKWYNMLKPIVTQLLNAKRGQVDMDFWGKIAKYETGGCDRSPILSGWITIFCAFDEEGNFRGDHSEKDEQENAEVEEWLPIETDDIPSGIVEVVVKINDNSGVYYNTVMFAGHMGAEIKNGGDTLQPTLGWVMALKSNTNE